MFRPVQLESKQVATKISQQKPAIKTTDNLGKYRIVTSDDPKFSLRPFSPAAFDRDQEKLRRIMSASENPELDEKKINLSYYLSDRTNYSPEYIFNNVEKVLKEDMEYQGPIDVKSGIDFFFSTIKFQNEANRANRDFENRGDEIYNSSMSDEKKAEAYEELRNDIREFQASQPDFDMVKSWIPQTLVENVATTLPYMAQVAAGAVAGAGVASLTGGTAAPLVLSSAFLSKVGSTVSAQGLLNSSGYVDRLIMQDKDGNYMDPDLANWGSELSSWVEAAVESMAFDVFAPWVKGMFGGSTNVLVNNTIGGIFKKGAFNYLKGVTAESAEEGLQRVVVDVTDNIIKTIDGNANGRQWDRTKAREILENAGKDFLQSVPTMAVLGVFSGGVGTAIDINQRKRNLKYDANTYFSSEGNEVSIDQIIFDSDQYANEVSERLKQARKGKEKLEPVKVIKVSEVNGKPVYRAVSGDTELAAIENSGGQVARVQEVNREDYINRIVEDDYEKVSSIMNDLASRTNSYVRVVDGEATLITRDADTLRKSADSFLMRSDVSDFKNSTITMNEFGVPEVTAGILVNGREARVKVMSESVDSVRQMYGESVENFITEAEQSLGQTEDTSKLRALLKSVYATANRSDVYEANTAAHESKQEVKDLLSSVNDEAGGLETFNDANRLVSMKKKPNVKQRRKNLSPAQETTEEVEPELHEQTLDEAIENERNKENQEQSAQEKVRQRASERASEEWAKEETVDPEVEKKFKKISEIVQKLDRSSGVQSVIIRDGREFPESVKQKAIDSGLSPNMISGTYANGTVYINAAAATARGVEQTWAHEWIAHTGMRGLFGQSFDQEMEKFYDSIGKKAVQSNINQVYHSMSKAEQADEYFAVMAERFESGGKIEQSALEKLKSLIRAALKKLGIIKSFNDTDVKNLLSDAYTHLNQDTITKRDGTMLQVSAYHGSPYSFDRFSSERIGTGEGNQVFGWGLYFTEVEDVARYYANALSKKDRPTVTQNGRILSENEIMELSEEPGAAEIERRVAENPDLDSETLAEELERDLYDWMEGVNPIPDWFESYLSEVEGVEINYNERSRNLYKVSLHEGKNPSEYRWIEWNENLTEAEKQRVANQAITEGVNIAYEENGKAILNASNEITGESLYTELTKSFVLGSDKEASLFLLRAGIDGIRYPAQSRGRGDGSKGYNYVVFDERAVKIEEQVRFQVAGLNAKNIDKKALKEYVTRIGKEGESREQIWRDTGLWQGLDGSIRFEIDPEEMKLKEDLKNDGITSLGSLIDYPELFKAYPKIKDVDVQYNITPDKTASGSFLPFQDRSGEGLFDIQPEFVFIAPNKKELKEVIVHEIQHYIQSIEGFAGGGSFRKELPQVREKNEYLIGQIEYLNRRMSQIVNQKDKLEKEERSKLNDEYIKLIRERENLTKDYVYDVPDEAYRRYRLKAGEVESRTVEKRLSMTPEERRAEPPWVTMEKMLEEEGLSDGNILFRVAPPTDSEAFRQWFGDSKVVDENGDPLVVYHGTGSEFTEFDIKRSGENFREVTSAGEGFFFFTDYAGPQSIGSSASEYATHAAKRNGGSANVMPVYLSMQDPLVVDVTNYGDFAVFGFDVASADIKRWMRKGRHDGVIAYHADDSQKVYAVSNPSQIKSVNNRGTWDAENPDIRFKVSEDEIRSRHKAAVKRAVERGLPVPQENLDLYQDEEWAKRPNDRQRTLNAYPWIINLAREADTPEELMEFISKRLEYDGGDLDVGMELVEDFYRMGQVEGTEQQFVDQFTDMIGTNQGLISFISEIDRNRDNFYGIGMPRSVFTSASRIDTLTPGQLDDLRASIYRNLRRTSRAYYFGIGNQEAIGTFRASDLAGGDESVSSKNVLDRVKLAGIIEDQELKDHILKGDFTWGDFSEYENQYTEQIAKITTEQDRLDRKITSLENDVAAEKEKSREKLTELRAQRDEKIKQEKQKLRDAYKKREETRKAKEAMRTQFSRIARRVPPASMPFDYGRKIEILTELFSDKIRNTDGYEGRAEKLTSIMRDFDSYDVKEFTEAVQGLDNLKLDEFTQEQIDDLYTLGESIRKNGRQLQSQAMFWRKERRMGIINEIVREVLGNENADLFSDFGSKETDKAMKSGPYFTLKAYTLRPTRVIKLLGGQEMYHHFIDRLNEATDNELRQWHRRHEAGVQQMKSLGISASDLARDITAGPTFSADQVIHLYLAMKNERSRDAVLYGNMITEETVNNLVSQLSNKEIAWAEWMLQEFEENYDRLREAFIVDKNIDMGKEENYFPMMRRDFEGRSLGVGEMMGEQWAIRNAWKKGYAPKKFTIERQTIAEEHQVPIRLGATGIWLSQIEAQEHYINGQELIKDLQYIQNDQSLKDALKQKYGRRATEWLQKYVNDYALPTTYSTNGQAERISKMLRSNMAIAYLSFNALTVLKQAPSIAFFLRKTTPFHLLNSAMKMISNPRQFIKHVEDMDPQVMVRSYNRIMEELYRMNEEKTASRIKKKVGTMGMKPIMWMDKAMVTIGWDAVYTSAKGKGMTDAEAAREAQRVTLDTQPAGRAKDLAEIYRTNEGFNWLLMFSNQLNQIWNMWTYDLPSAIKEHDAWQAAGIMAGLMVSGVSIGFLSGWRPPEEPEELPMSLAKEVLGNYFSSMSIIGGDIKSGFSGDYFASGMQIVPAATSIGELVGDVSEGDVEGIGKDILRVLKDVGVTTGVPTTAIDRTVKTIKNRDLVEMLGYGFMKHRR